MEPPFRLDVVAVKGTADEQGWTNDRITKRGSNALPIRAARYRWEAGDAGPSFKESIEPSSTPRKSKLFPMRCVPWWKAYGPSWRTSCRISTAIEMALKLPPTGLGSGIDKDRPDYTVY